MKKKKGMGRRRRAWAEYVKWLFSSLLVWLSIFLCVMRNREKKSKSKKADYCIPREESSQMERREEENIFQNTVHEKKRLMDAMNI